MTISDSLSTSLVFPDYTYTVSHRIPSIATYRHLRRSVGMTVKTVAAAAIGLPRGLFCVQILARPSSLGSSGADHAPLPSDHQTGADADSDSPDPSVVAMGRVIGDGGCLYEVVDIMVLPAHQKRGLGKLVMREVMHWLEENVPESAYVSLIADGEAKKLYAGFGFVETATRGSVGMVQIGGFAGKRTAEGAEA